MGCFPACFTSSNRRNHKKPVAAITPSTLHHILEATEGAVKFEPTKLEDNVKDIIKPITESKEENQEEQLGNAEKKEDISREIEAILDTNGATIVVLTSRLLSHRYENCSNSEEEEDESLIGLSGSDLNGDEECCDLDDDEVVSNKEVVVVQEQESSESLFSISIGSRKQASNDDDEVDEKEVNSPMPKAKPTENLTQLKEEKKNMNVEQDLCIHISPEPTLKLSKQFTRATLKSSDLNPVDQETGIDTSLSSWLVGSETTPKTNGSNNSVGSLVSEKLSLGDRPVLGAWTSEELKQWSTNSSNLNRSLSASPDQMPMLGTVGSYWSHIGQTSDSDLNSSCEQKENRAGRNKENTKAILKTIPLEARLEKAAILV